MLLRKLFISWKEEMMTMENYLKEIKGIIVQLAIIICRDTRRFTLIIVGPFLTQGISTF
jgi:hypothetical protein